MQTQSRSKSDKQGRLNPFSVTALGQGPAPDNQPEVRDIPVAGPALDRYEVFSGVSVDVCSKPHVDSSRLATEKDNPFLQEDANQLSRHLTPEATGIKVRKEPITFENSRRNDDE